jgi:CRISPR-associated protein Csx17
LRTKHELSGIRPEPLASYLAGLGLVRVLGDQADQDITASWHGGTLSVTTAVEDIAQWLAESYVPAPVLSPWNGGSGFGEKDKKPLEVLKQLREHPSSRLADFRAAIAIAEAVARDHRDTDKKTLVQAFRNLCPEELLPWIDASVVLTTDDLQFPPLLGSGGNDGRFDFSSNFHQRLLDVIDTPASLGLAKDLLYGSAIEKLSSAAIGQFDPSAAGGPGSSRFGPGSSLVNPWTFVLFIEGALLFASSVVRRNQFDAGRAAIPFTVTASSEGSSTGAANEETRGEIWAPLWDGEFGLPEIRQLFTEARASWRGRPARRAVQFYAATRTVGVSRGITAFNRFGLQRRNGLAFTAVPLARVEVVERSQVRLMADVEDWANRFAATDTSAAIRTAYRSFQAKQWKYVSDGEPRDLVDMLAALTTLELAVGRSGRARDKVPVRYAPPAKAFLAELAASETRELRLATGLASCSSTRRTLRQLLLPIDPHPPNDAWRDSSVVPGFGIRPLPDVLADVLVWRSRTAADEPGASAFRGVTTFQNGIPIPAADLHWFATSDKPDWPLIEHFLRACLALNWRGVSHEWHDNEPAVPVATLGLLLPLARGLAMNDKQKIAMSADWAAGLRAGHVKDVHMEARIRMRQAGRDAVRFASDSVPGVRIAAALVPRSRGSDLRLFTRELNSTKETS